MFTGQLGTLLIPSTGTGIYCTLVKIPLMATLFAITVKSNTFQCNITAIDFYFCKDNYVEFLTLSAGFLFKVELRYFAH